MRVRQSWEEATVLVGAMARRLRVDLGGLSAADKIQLISVVVAAWQTFQQQSQHSDSTRYCAGRRGRFADTLKQLCLYVVEDLKRGNEIEKVLMLAGWAWRRMSFGRSTSLWSRQASSRRRPGTALRRCARQACRACSSFLSSRITTHHQTSRLPPAQRATFAKLSYPTAGELPAAAVDAPTMA